MMALYQRVEQIMLQLRPAFRRQATFHWFVLLLWGILLSSQPAAVTSYLNALGLGECCYGQALHWFHSTAFDSEGLCRAWCQWLQEHPQLVRLRAQRVYVGDGIKVSKEGKRMPGVKRLHQQSANVNKPEWIRGHYFSGLGLLLGDQQAAWVSPIVFKLHDGFQEEEEEPSKPKTSLVTKMARLCCQYMEQGSYGVLDAYYGCKPMLMSLREGGLHLISRVRITTSARASFCPCPQGRGRGRRRQWGDPIKLKEVFAPQQQCESASVELYGKTQQVYYQCWRCHWDSPTDEVLFVLSQWPDGKRMILLSSDPSLTGVEVIQTYAQRFKIEVCFRSLIHLLEGFAYRFWLKSLRPLGKWPQNLSFSWKTEAEAAVAQKLLTKVEAFERFVNLHAIALGLLQVLALEMPKQVWQGFRGWFRTLPHHGYPTEQVVRLCLQHQQRLLFSKSSPALLLHQLLRDKSHLCYDHDSPPLVT